MSENRTTTVLGSQEEPQLYYFPSALSSYSLNPLFFLVCLDSLVIYKSSEHSSIPLFEAGNFKILDDEVSCSRTCSEHNGTLSGRQS